MLLDEPLTGLDVLSARTIRGVIAAEKSAGRTVVFTTHDLADAGEADHVLLLATRQVGFGTPDEVLGTGAVGRGLRWQRAAAARRQRVVDDPHHTHGN
ncbi:MAG: hypothetical protein R2716_05510 [Microthrixaceae bacterium]